MSRLTRALRNAGPSGVARRVVQLAGGAIYRRRRLLVYRAPLTTVNAAGGVDSPNAPCTFDVLTMGEAREFRDAPADVLASLRGYLDIDIPGLLLLMARVDGELAGWCMVFVGAADWPLTETGTRLQLTPTDAIFISAYTAPAFRRRHINRALMGETARLALAQGATDLWAWHEHGNEAPRRNMLGVGMTLVGVHEQVRVLGVRLRPRTDIVPNV